MRWGRIAVVVVLIVSTVNWVGWAVGIQELTRFYPTWQPMTPGAGLWLAALGVSILLQSGTPSPVRLWTGRGIAIAAGGLAAVVLAEFAMGRSSGVDRLWFGEAVAVVQSSWPGRLTAQTALSTLLLAVVVAQTRASRPWILRIRTGLAIAAMTVPVITVVAYLFDAPVMMEIARSLGMAVATALGLMLLGAATVLVQPDRGPVAWWLAQANKWSIFRMGVIVAGFPLAVGLSRHALVALGAGAASALAVSTAVGTSAVAAWMFYFSRHEQMLIAANESERALLRANSDGMLDPQALLDAVRDPAGRVVDFVCRSANRALCSYLGLKEEDLIGRSAVRELRNFEYSGLMSRYVECMESGAPVMLNDLPSFNKVHHEMRYYDLRLNRVGPNLLSVTWSDVTERFRAAARIRESDERYRRLIDHAAIGMCIVTPDGRFEVVNDALCQLLGYDAETLMQKNWREVTVTDYLKEDLRNVEDLVEGRADSFRLVNQYIHADGHLIWSDMSTSCVRDGNGRVERFISQVIDITAAMEANERNYVLAQRLGSERERLAAELHSAADYMKTIMPEGLTGEVDIVSRYLPSRELGGDCFDYTWIDDDHLLVYLIDVSGHGIEPALLSVSVHNMIRSGSLGRETVLMPEAALTELNRLFQMDQQRDHFFTAWYGVYTMSARTLRYANAGAPAALAFSSATGGAIEVIELSATSPPVGMFEDTVFVSREYAVPAGSRILIYSDGASEISLGDGRYLAPAEFVNVCTRAVGSPGGSLDVLVAELRALTPTGFFEDDCSLIQLSVD